MNAARLLAVASLATLAACNSHAPKPDNITLANQRECPVNLAAGQRLTLTLPSDPTTGYRWLMQNAGQPALRSLGAEVFSNPEDAGVVGGAGQSMWRFEAKQAGSGTLLLVYQQPWAPEVKPIKSFECVISVAQ